MFTQSTKGFTLLELIMVIVIVGILSTMTTNIITLPVKSYVDMERRTTLVDSAEMALRRIQQELRHALPNSIRISPDGIEMLHLRDKGRYRAKLASDGSGDILDFTGVDNSFDVIGTLKTNPSGELVIYKAGLDAYSATNRATIKNTSTKKIIELNTAKLFIVSPERRFYVVDTAITYSCSSGNELRRYDNTIDSGYGISNTAPNLSSLNYKIQAKGSALSCSFSYDAGNGLVSLEIEITDKTGESIKLFHQVHVGDLA